MTEKWYMCVECGEWTQKKGACECGGQLVRACHECGERLSECQC